MQFENVATACPRRERRTLRSHGLKAGIVLATLSGCLLAGGAEASPVTLSIDGTNQDATSFTGVYLTFDNSSSGLSGFSYSSFAVQGQGYTSTSFYDFSPMVSLSAVSNGSDWSGKATKSVTVSVYNHQFNYTQSVTGPDPREPGAPFTQVVDKIGYAFAYEITTTFMGGLATYTSVSGPDIDPTLSLISYTGDLYMSAVPLPASAPLFGAAVLALGVAGYAAKRNRPAAVF